MMETDSEDGTVAQADFQRSLQDWLQMEALLGYHEHAWRWCEENGVSSMDELSQRWEAFCDGLSMKRMQRKRVEKSLPAFAGRAAGVAPAPQLHSGDPTSFGPPENPYTVTGFLGEGANARVFECMRGRQSFAVKVISLAKMRAEPNFEELLTKLRRETDILMNLQHERIVSLHETHETDDHIFIVMELVQGGDLLQHVRAAGHLSEDDARRVFCQLVDTLTYIHEQRVVHRDLKLENILVCRKPPAGQLEIKVSDFGTSKLIMEGTGKTRCGTPQYWAPEVALIPSTRGYDFSVDLWSLGVVLYVMLEGHYPFYGEHMDDQIRRGDVHFGAQSRSSPEAQDLMRGLIQVEHWRRISLRGCLEHVWCRSRGGGGAAAAQGAAAAAPATKGGREGRCSPR